jgi:hypothetical protein
VDGNQFADELLKVAAELHKISEVPRKTVQIAAPKIADLVAQEFQQGASPTGATWAPLKTGGQSTLTKSGRMRSKVKVVADGTLVRGTLPAPANIHQYGSTKRNIQARPMVLRGSTLPATWEKALDESVTEALATLAPELQGSK